jgi:site-specific DNA-methyltransferase (adenine-specific)
MTSVSPVWCGTPALEHLLVPVVELRTHPRNARRGNVAVIAASLSRFGQQRPIVALPTGLIVAGNHTYRAAVEHEGWTHIAVVQTDLSGEEVEAFLLADNRTGDLGTYDDHALADLLRPKYDTDTLLGTGFDRSAVERLLTEIQWRDRFKPGDPPRPLDQARKCPRCGATL